MFRANLMHTIFVKRVVDTVTMQEYSSASPPETEIALGSDGDDWSISLTPGASSCMYRCVSFVYVQYTHAASHALRVSLLGL